MNKCILTSAFFAAISLTSFSQDLAFSDLKGTWDLFHRHVVDSNL